MITAVLLFLAAVAAPAALADTPAQTLFERSKNISCYRIPALVTAPNGDLIAVADRRIPNCNDLRSNKNIEIGLRRSKDHGATWEKEETAVRFDVGASASDPSMVVDTTTHTIFLFYNFMNFSSSTPSQYYFHVIQSDDNGYTWSPPRDITKQIVPAGMLRQFIFMTSGRAFYDPVTQLIVHNVVNVHAGGAIPFGSSDHGKTWWYRDVIVKPADESKSIIMHLDNEKDNGTWVINSRTRQGHRVWHESHDSGFTWKTRPIEELLDPGCNAGFITYTPSSRRARAGRAGGNNKEALIFTNAFNRHSRKNLTVHSSWDGGVTWGAGYVLRSEGAMYSSPTLIGNGNLGVLYEKEEGGVLSIVFTQVALKDVL